MLNGLEHFTFIVRMLYLLRLEDLIFAQDLNRVKPKIMLGTNYESTIYKLVAINDEA